MSTRCEPGAKCYCEGVFHEVLSCGVRNAGASSVLAVSDLYFCPAYMGQRVEFRSNGIVILKVLEGDENIFVDKMQMVSASFPPSMTSGPHMV